MSKRYEYKIRKQPEYYSSEELNVLGNDGWQMVNDLVFMREITESKIEDKEPTAFKDEDEFKWDDWEVKNILTCAVNNIRDFVMDNDGFIKDYKGTKWPKVQLVKCGTGTANETINEEKKDWEIVEWVYDSGKMWSLTSPSVEEKIKNGCKIKSVKRLSDNEVFSVGDEIILEGFVDEDNDLNGKASKITKFFIHTTGEICYNDEITGNGYSLSKDLRKPTPTANDVMQVRIKNGESERTIQWGDKITTDNPVLDRQDTYIQKAERMAFEAARKLDFGATITGYMGHGLTHKTFEDYKNNPLK